MQLAALVIVCVVIAMGTLQRPLAVPLVAMSMWVWLPGSAIALSTGVSSGPLALHPAVILLLVGACVQLAARPSLLLAAVSYRPDWTVLLLTVAGVATAIGFYSGLGGDSFAAAGNQVLGPLILFFMLGGALLERVGRLTSLRNWFLATAAVQAMLAVVQLALGSPVFFAAQYAQQRFLQQGLNRWMGTLDHPLILSFLLTVAIFMLASLHRWYMTLPLLLILLAGVLATQSRLGAVVAVVGVLYIVRGASLPWRQRALLTLPLAAGVIYALASGATDGLAARVSDDTGSTSARADALGYFLDHIREFAWLGQGLNGSFAVSDNAGLGTSFESAILMYSIDIGVVATLIYFGVMLSTVVRSWKTPMMSGVTAAAVVAFLTPQSFSALSGNTAAPMIVWAVFAMAGFGVAEARRARVTSNAQRRATGGVRVFGGPARAG